MTFSMHMTVRQYKAMCPGWYPSVVPSAPTTDPEFPAAHPVRVEYGVHCARCNEYCPDAEKVPDFKCFRCRT